MVAPTMRRKWPECKCAHWGANCPFLIWSSFDLNQIRVVSAVPDTHQHFGELDERSRLGLYASS